MRRGRLGDLAEMQTGRLGEEETEGRGDEAARMAAVEFAEAEEEWLAVLLLEAGGDGIHAGW